MATGDAVPGRWAVLALVARRLAPMMLVAFAHHSHDGSFVVLRRHRGFVTAMAAGPVIGTLVSGLLFNVVPARRPAAGVLDQGLASRALSAAGRRQPA